MSPEQSSKHIEDEQIAASQSPVPVKPAPTPSGKGRPLRVLASAVGKEAVSEVGQVGNVVGRALLQCEKLTKEALFGCHMCGQCILQQTALICPMRCPKGMRNGPCGGPSLDGKCEVYPEKPCIWVEIYQRSRRFGLTGRVEKLQWPLDWSLQGTSAYGNVLNGKWFTPQWKRVLRRPGSMPRAGTRLEEALTAGRFVVTAELGPPRSADAEVIRKKARYFRDKVVAVNVTDNSR